ncbi:MAG TPA: hypothetical protein VLM89_04830 [Phycisphaerae bacterium]|nr:hypothetical protein [Phycisphaerae bacterium]
MAGFRINMTVEVDQKGNGLCIQTPVPVQLVHEQNKWRLQCATPPVATDLFDDMEEALIAGARRVGDELQAAVIERPLVAGRITPDTVRGIFR